MNGRKITAPALEDRLIAKHWWFCAASGSTIRPRARVVKVEISPIGQEPIPPPDGGRNVWVKNGTVAVSRCWVQLDLDTLKEVAWGPAQFQTWQHGAWRAGFGRGQAALVRGVVPAEPGNPPAEIEDGAEGVVGVPV
ncbi:MAG: hypothetical protein LAP87_03235 [Acidobacteriia bacterium]|nr:hypothetical protein [Terriglobia bacterium]